MNNLIAGFTYAVIPLSATILLTLVAPPLGVILSLRNEILLGLALPSVGAAIIAGAIFFGVNPQALAVHYVLVAITVFLVMILFSIRGNTERISCRQREIILAALFVAGNTVSMLFMALSAQVEAHFNHLLQGEILAVGGTELIITACIALGLSVAVIRFRGLLYAFAIDEEGLKIKEKSYTPLVVMYQAAATLVITGGIILVGPLLTTAMLILPVFFAERRTRGLDRLMITVVLVCLCGVVCGFIGAIITDLPPAPVVVCTITLCGVVLRIPGLFHKS